MQTETLIGWKSGKTTYVLPWDRMDGAWLYGLRTLVAENVSKCNNGAAYIHYAADAGFPLGKGKPFHSAFVYCAHECVYVFATVKFYRINLDCEF